MSIEDLNIESKVEKETELSEVSSLIIGEKIEDLKNISKLYEKEKEGESFKDLDNIVENNNIKTDILSGIVDYKKIRS